MSKIEVTGNFPGGNPKAENRIISKPGNLFLVYPEYESEELPGHKFRMDLKVINPFNDMQEIMLNVNWNEPLYMHLRKGIYLKHAEQKQTWKHIQAHNSIDDSTVQFRLKIPAGESDISFQPRYDFLQLSELLGICKNNPVVSIEKMAPHLDFPIYLFNFFKNDAAGNRKVIFIIARIHAYETAGSYCLDGAVRELITNKEYREHVLKYYDLIIIPIISPNAVNKGYCRLNANIKQGRDLTREWDDKDHSCMVIKSIAQQYPLAGFLEIHNWMYQKLDGVKYLNRRKMNKYIGIMKCNQARNKIWKKLYKYRIFTARYTGAKKWIRDNTKAACMTLEYPWYGRSVTDMRLLGVNTIQSFAEFII